MEKYMHGEFSPKKLTKVEAKINCFYSRSKHSRLVAFLIICFYSLIQGAGYSLSLRYVGDFHSSFSYNEIFILKDIQSILDPWFFKAPDFLQLAFPILVMVSTSIVSYIAASLFAAVLNIIKILLCTGHLVKRISDKNQIEKIQKLIQRCSKIHKISDPYIPVAIVVIFSYLIAVAYPVYSGMKDGNVISSDNLLPILILVGLLLVVMILFGTIPLMISFHGVTAVNSSFYRKISKSLSAIEKVLDNWWVETDPQERRKRQQEAEEAYNRKRYSDSYISTMAKVYIREQSQSSSSLPDHGPYGTATNCGMPRFGMPPSIDVSDM